jgi:hypothetical protein
MADRNNPPNVETIQVSPTSGDKNDSGSSKADSGSSKHRGWTAEWDLALLEETGNCGAHVPGHNQVLKCWEAVTAAIKARGLPHDNPRTIQRRFEKLKAKYVAKRAKEEATPGVEDFGDDDDDPFNQLMEDLLLEMKDHEAEKEQTKEAKKNIEASLVAGGKLLRDKAAHQILGGTAVAIGGVEPKFRASPTSSVSDFDASAETSSASKKRRAAERSSFEVDLMEHENKKMDLELKKFELEAKKFETDIELKREQQHQLMTFHKEEMELKRKEIDVQHQALQFNLTRHQDEMRMRFMEFEQWFKKDNT